jgi:hypothetical protein
VSRTVPHKQQFIKGIPARQDNIRAISNLKQPSKFDRCLSNIKQEIEFLMEFEVDKDLAIPENVIDKLDALRAALECYLK